MSRRYASVLGALLVVSRLWSVSAHAEDKIVPLVQSAPVSTPAPPGNLAYVLELLRSKNLITAEEAASLAGKGGGASEAPLIDLLRSKGVITDQEAAGLAKSPEREQEPLLKARINPPSQDRKFISLLRERWVKNKNRGRDFDEWFAGVDDPEEIIGKMRVMGGISAEEGDDLLRNYRDNYVSGAISAVMEKKENDYLERVRKGIAWELDEKIKEKFKNEWSQRIKLGGDVRLRWEQDFFDGNNGDFLKPDNTTQLMNSKIDRQMLRIRVRLGVDVKVADDWKVGIGLATDSNRSPGSPVSNNVTLGDFFNKKPITIDKAYIQWSPDPTVTVFGGRFANPWLSTDLVWDPDINFDGIALQLNPILSSKWSLFLTSGVFPIQEVELSSHDKWLFGNQVGIKHQSADNVTTKVGVAYYHFVNTVGVVNDPSQPGLNDWTAPLFQQKGNTLMDIDPSSAIKTAYASDFHELNVTGLLDLGLWDPVHLLISADYVNNLGFKRNEVEARAGGEVKKETEGFQVGLTLGYPTVQDLWEWKGYVFYKYLQSDAVLDAFADSDFHLGGTNAKGWIASAELGIAKNVWFSAKWFTTDVISGPPLSIDVFHFNLNAKF